MLKLARRKTQSRSIALNHFYPFVSVYDPERIESEPEVEIETNDSEPDVLPMRLGKKAFTSYRKKCYQRCSECFFCGDSIPEIEDRTVDHIIPESRGGPNHPANLVTCCHRCNRKKNDLSAIEWRDKIKAKLAYYQPLFNRLESLIEEHGLNWFPVTLPPQSVRDREANAQRMAIQAGAVATD